MSNKASRQFGVVSRLMKLKKTILHETNAKMEKMQIDHKAKTIPGLNEDCLFEIIKYLDLKDLYELKQAHRCFRNSINRVVPNKSFNINVYDFQYWIGYGIKGRKLLKSFRKQLQRLSIRFPPHFYYKQEKLAIILRTNYEILIEFLCANGNIQYFSIANIEFSDEFIKENVHFFQSLLSLKMDIKQKRHDSFLTIMPLLHTAKHLTIETEGEREYGDINRFLQKVNPNRLEYLRLLGFNNKIQFEHLPINRTLKRLEAPNCHFEFGCTFDRCGHTKEKEFIPKIIKLVEISEKLVKLTLKFHVDNFNLPHFHEQLVSIRRSKKSEQVLHVVIEEHDCPRSKSRYANRPSLDEKYVKISYNFLSSFACDE